MINNEEKVTEILRESSIEEQIDINIRIKSLIDRIEKIEKKLNDLEDKVNE